LKITYLELPTKDLQAQKDYYSNILELPVQISGIELKVTVGTTELVFTQTDSRFDGAYHFAFNIPENQFASAKEWVTGRSLLLREMDGNDEFASESWNSHSVYFKDAAGNVLEFITRHNLKNAAKGNFNSAQILNISEIGLPSEKVIDLANGLCSQLGLSVFKQNISETFTPIGDDNGLLIIPIKDRIWIPNSGVPAKLLPVKLRVEVEGKKWGIRGYPYEVFL